VLWDLSQVDPSDLSMLFAGHGRFRIAFAELDPPAGHDPSGEDVEAAVRSCCENPYYAFSKPAGTSLICIQGDWSNVIDARIKGQLAAAAIGERPDSPYTPLYVRVPHAPRPWGVTALLSEHTGSHQPLDIEWSLATDGEPVVPHHIDVKEVLIAMAPPIAATPAVEPPPAGDGSRSVFSSFWEFAVAMNRSDPAALALANSGLACPFPIEASDVRKLLGTIWFRGVVPRLSEPWRARILEAFAEGVAIPNHQVRRGRQSVQLRDMSYADLQELAKTSTLAAIRPELDLLLAVGRLWGESGLSRIRFTDAAPNGTPRLLASLMQGMRHGDSTPASEDRR